MYTRQITSEETYTLSEARRIINAERKAKIGSLLYKAKQKFVGIILISISIIIPALLDDATASFILFPLGVGVLHSKESVIG